MPIKDILLSIFVIIIWSGNFAAAKVGMQYLPPMLYTALRFTLVFLLLAPFLKKPKKRTLHFIMLLALTLGTPHFSMLFGAVRLGLSIPATIIALQLGVPFSCLLGTYFFGDRLGMWRSMGMTLSFMGLLLVAGTPDITEYMLPFLMTLAGAFCWALSNVVMKKMGDVPVFQVFGWMSLFTVPMLLVLSLLIEHPTLDTLRHAPLPAWLALGYTVLLSTLLAYGIWYPLLQKHSISHLAPFNLLSPVIGIAIGELFFPAALSWQIVAGGLITMAGVSIIIIRRPRNLALSKET